MMERESGNGDYSLFRFERNHHEHPNMDEKYENKL